MFDRRVVLGGLGVSALAVAPAWGADPSPSPAPSAPPPEKGQPLFAAGPLANNSIAKTFITPEQPLIWPNPRLLGPPGKTKLEDYRGKVVLLTLWAEWSQASMPELAGMEYHTAHSQTDKFEIVPILTGSRAFGTLIQAEAGMQKIGLKGLTTLFDASQREHRVSNLARGGALPSLILVDADGNLRGRSSGVGMHKGDDGKVVNLWGTNSSVEFLGALGRGTLPVA